MSLNVNERGDYVATFRWIEVRLMETLAAWVPTTPEMEVKLVFGAHIWDTAQHADMLGKRAAELRLPMHDELAPSPGATDLLAEIAAITETDKRVAAFYNCVLPALETRYRDYLDRVDQLLDGPTVRVIDRILADMARMGTEAVQLLEEAPAVRLADDSWTAELRRREAELGQIVVHRRPAEPVAGAK